MLCKFPVIRRVFSANPNLCVTAHKMNTTFAISSVRSKSTVQKEMDVVIVGGGPVACLMALELRARDIKVRVYEKKCDPRTELSGTGYSFNLALTLRGMSSLSPTIRDSLHKVGVSLAQRVIHQPDGSIVYQAYSANKKDEILSIPRGVLYSTLLNEAEKLGAQFHFNHDCLKVDTMCATAKFIANDKIVDVKGNMLIGSDGANSFVRYEMSRKFGGSMDLQQEYTSYGHVEAQLLATPDGQHSLKKALFDPAVPQSHAQGMHFWPRGDFLLLGLPNTDSTYTATIFMPLSRFETFKTPEQITAFCKEHFADVFALHPTMVADFHGVTPAQLKKVKISQYHQGRTVLIGDAAHTMVPFYGQGINCCFEDVKSFFEIFDHDAKNATAEDLPAFIDNLFSQYSSVRKAPGDAIADLSYRNLKELSSSIGKKDYHARCKLETALHAKYPREFIPLYQMVAFSLIPYHEVIIKHEKQTERLNALCAQYDINTQQEEIIAAYVDKNHSNVPQTLDLSQGQLKELLEGVTGRLQKYLQEIKDRKHPASYFHDSLDIYKYKDGLKVCVELRELTPPQQGTELKDLLDTVFDVALPCGLMHHHPGAMAHIPTGGLVQGAVGEFITRSLNRFGGVWLDNPGFIQLETNVIHWFCNMMGYGDRSFGYLSTGGSTANLMGVVCAHHDVKFKAANPEAWTTATSVVYSSAQCHFSTKKAAKIAGISLDNIRSIAINKDYSMNIDKLVETIIADKKKGLTPTCVISTAGTTNTGAVDDLVRLAAVCKEHGIWLHVDACFGGFFHITQRGRAFLKGIEAADSISLDAHKSFFMPHGISAFLVKERNTLKKTFQITAEYLSGFSKDELHVDFCQVGPELTREVRGLTVWLPMKMHGIKAFEHTLDHKLDLAHQLLADLRAIPEITVIQNHALNLPVVNFKVNAASAAESAQKTKDICELICSYGNVFICTTELPDAGCVLRVCILHHLTDEKMIALLLGDIHRALKTVNSEEGK